MAWLAWGATVTIVTLLFVYLADQIVGILFFGDHKWIGGVSTGSDASDEAYR